MHWNLLSDAGRKNETCKKNFVCVATIASNDGRTDGMQRAGAGIAGPAAGASETVSQEPSSAQRTLMQRLQKAAAGFLFELTI